MCVSLVCIDGTSLKVFGLKCFELLTIERIRLGFLYGEENHLIGVDQSYKLLYTLRIRSRRQDDYARASGASEREKFFLRR